MQIYANNPNHKTWLEVEENSDFPIQNIPFGIAKVGDKPPFVATRIGDAVINLYALGKMTAFDDLPFDVETLNRDSLNDLIAEGKGITLGIRDRVSQLFNIQNPVVRDNPFLQMGILHEAKDVTMLLPVKIGDYTDFYSSREHATNVGIMFRDPKNALLPNWLHIPVGYHGRSSSIVVSGTDIIRPKGQTLPKEGEPPVFGASARLDFELEMAFIVGKNTQLGDSIKADEAENYIFGLCLFNDWSARDIQQWEYVPLGPFLGKNFASTMSSWVVMIEALDGARVAQPAQEPQPLPYLQTTGDKNYNIDLEVDIIPENGIATTVCKSNFQYMYWSMSQQLAHHTVNGCNVRIGDVCASGTISGKDENSYGSMLELAWKGTKPLKMADGTERKFINDNDTVTMRAWATTQEGIRIGFGEAVGKVLPAKDL